jgi:hypothetical protein
VSISKESTDGKAHSVLGASSSHRWIHCPGSVELAKKAPTPKTSVYAMEGTAAHELAEKCLISKKSPKDFLGKEILGFKVTDEMVEAVNLYVDTIRKERKGQRIMVEQRFDLSWLYPGMFGTNDACIYHPDKFLLRVYDYKHGAGIAVDAVDNSQLVYYAIGASKEILKTHSIKEVEMIIIQPRAFHRDGPIRRWTIPFKELKKWAKRIKAAAEMTKMEDAPLYPGEHCRFCPASGLCPEQYKQTQLQAQTDFEKVPDPRLLSIEDVSRVVKAAPMIKKFLASCEKVALEAKLNGKEVPDIKLVRKRADRKWVESDDLDETLIALGISDDELYTMKRISVAQAEAKLDKKSIKDLWEKKEGDLTIAPLTDKRKEIILDMKEEFKEVSSE